jgi:hypothetical protein
VSGSYYYIYNCQHFIHLVNVAIEAAWENLKNQVIEDPGTGGTARWNTWTQGTVVPFMDFDPITNRAWLQADERLFQEASVPRFRLSFDDRLSELFAGLPFLKETADGITAYPPWAHIRFINRYNNRVKQKNALNQDIYMLQAYQETTSIALWNPVASIVFASSLLPIIPTQTSAPKDIGSQSNNLLSGGNNSNLLPILSDFSIAVDGNNQYRPMVEYNPGAEYRLIDMNSTTNLNRLDIIVYWKDRFGGLHPFQLQPGCAASVKLMFRRKDFSVVS